MRVTIEHREETSGLLRNHKECYVDCTVEFSDEERAIIKTRDLYNNSFDIRTSTPMVSDAAFYGFALLRIPARFMIMGGLVCIVLNVEPWGYLFFVGVPLEIYCWRTWRKQDKRMDSDQQRITIKRLLTNPHFTVHAWNAGAAKGVEQEIREHLLDIKGNITTSAQLQTKHTFEL
jgi:hypothetical protein